MFFYVNPRAIEMHSDIKVDKLFLGTCCLSPEGVFAPTVEEAYMKREISKEQTKLFCSRIQASSKKSLFHRVCQFDEIDIIVTDNEPKYPFDKIFKDFEVKILIASVGTF